MKLKPEKEFIHELIDIVSKNGVLLLNACPKSDGTIPDDQKEIFYAIGDFLKINGEGIYATRPWNVHGEGPNLHDTGRGLSADMGHVSKKAKLFTSKDLRFTESKDGKTIYVHALGWPEEMLIVKSMSNKDNLLKSKIKSVKLLENGRESVWKQTAVGLEIDVTNVKTNGKHAYTWAVEL